ncbi:MAG: hypothetical protein KatS3mg022_0691 [Armatimonadota bacterium]|nr:MAG: hypothetical protein KatS3mg022_0691 [Armatimonadota bacterium]
MRSFCLILVALTVCAQGSLGSPSLQIPLQGNYLLDSEVTLNLTANEMEQVQIAVYRIDPFRQFQPAEASSVAEWVSKLNLGRIKPVLTRTVRHPNPPGYATLDVPLGKLPAGAYVIEASAGNLRSRALILVTGMMIIARTVGSQTLIYVCNAENGAPIAGADVRVIAARDVSGHQQPHEWRLLTDRQGIALFTPGAEGIRSSWSILASAGKWQAYTRYQESADTIIVRGGGSEDAALWRFYLFTDLPIYQPGQTVNWKLIARWWDEGTYHTPANRSLRYSIIDPQNEQIGRGEIRLNSFGSAFGSLEIPEKASPGRYYLRLYDEQGREIRTLLLCRVGTLPPLQEGYYVVSWEQVGAPAPRRVIARHRFYVVKPGSETEIHAPAEVAPVEAYPAAGDVGPGQKLPVLVILQNPPRHVLLIEEGSHILQRHLLYVKRKVELVYLPLNERHTPVFTLNAIVVEDGQAFGFTWNVVVPPRQHHLKVQVQPDKDGFWVVRTTDERNRPLSADVSIALVNRASLSAVLPFPAPWFDGAGTALGQHIPVPPLPPGYPEDPRLYFALPAPLDTFHRFDTSYDAAPYVKIVRGYQVLPIPHDWRYRATEWVPRSPLPGSEIPKPPGLISEGKLSHPFRGYWEVSLPKGAPNQIDESTYAQLPYTRYVQQSLRDAVLAQLPDDGEVTPRTLFWLPRVVTDEKGTATFKLPSEAGKGGVWIVIACSEDSQFGWLLQAIVPR